MDLSNKVLDEFGNPVPNATVDLYDHLGSKQASTTSSAQGVWAFTGRSVSETWEVVITTAGSQARRLWGGIKVQLGELGVIGASTFNGAATFVAEIVAQVAIAAQAGVKMTQIATPAAPGAGLTLLYPKSDGKLYTRSGTGTETTVGEGWNATTKAVATAGQTVFPLGATATRVAWVFVNGVFRDASQYTVQATTITFSAGRVVGDEVVIFYVAA